MRAAGVALLLLLAGCGGSDETSPRTVTVTVAQGGWAEGDCNAAGRYGGTVYRVCLDGRHGHVDRLEDGSAETIEIAPPGTHGGWHWGTISPDGRTLLLQWHAACEVPLAFLVSSRGGTPKPVTGEDDWQQAPESVALGWTADGEPIVRLPEGVCGRGAEEPGTYVIADGALRRVDDELEPSLEPRDP